MISLGSLADPIQLDSVVNGLLHKQRKRKIVAAGYIGGTLRENLGVEGPRS
ncbi:hypothetical protein [Streptomyces mirabilis]|uniref:hypothetical protein n=1 Tax=Streptomyces mirabilis TaxID=68239 RepID=UPI003326BA7A